MTEQERWAWRVDENPSGDVSFFPIPDTVDAPDPPSDGDKIVLESRALTAESRVQELEGERDEARRVLQSVRADHEREVRRRHAAESHLARLEEGRLGLAEIDALLWVTDTRFQRQDPNIAEARSKLEAQRAALTHSTPPRSDG